jgi:hypothetical protein
MPKNMAHELRHVVQGQNAKRSENGRRSSELSSDFFVAVRDRGVRFFVGPSEIATGRQQSLVNFPKRLFFCSRFYRWSQQFSCGRAVVQGPQNAQHRR